MAKIDYFSIIHLKYKTQNMHAYESNQTTLNCKWWILKSYEKINEIRQNIQSFDVTFDLKINYRYCHIMDKVIETQDGYLLYCDVSLVNMINKKYSDYRIERFEINSNFNETN